MIHQMLINLVLGIGAEKYDFLSASWENENAQLARSQSLSVTKADSRLFQLHKHMHPGQTEIEIRFMLDRFHSFSFPWNRWNLLHLDILKGNSFAYLIFFFFLELGYCRLAPVATRPCSLSRNGRQNFTHVNWFRTITDTATLFIYYIVLVSSDFLSPKATSNERIVAAGLSRSTNSLQNAGNYMQNSTPPLLKQGWK